MLALLIYLFSFAAFASEEIAVIINKNNPVDEITTKQLVDLYMGKLIAFPDGKQARPFDLEVNSPLREHFYEALTKRPIGSINAYWARVKFGGRARPPEHLDNSTLMLSRVQEIDNAIGYVKLSEVTTDVKVVYTLVQ